MRSINAGAPILGLEPGCDGSGGRGRWWIALLATSAACSSVEPNVEVRDGLFVEIRTDRRSYEPGDLATLTLANLGTERVHFDPCRIQVEGKVVDGYWSGSFGFGGCLLVGAPSIQALVSLRPGESAKEVLPINGRAYSGQWRAHLRFLDDSGGHLTGTPSHSNEFSVKGAALPEDLLEFRWVLSGTDSANAFIARRMEDHDAR